MLSDWTPPWLPFLKLTSSKQQHMGENVVRTIAMDGKLHLPSTPLVGDRPSCRATVSSLFTERGTHTWPARQHLPKSSVN